MAPFSLRANNPGNSDFPRHSVVACQPAWPCSTGVTRRQTMQPTETSRRGRQRPLQLQHSRLKQPIYLGRQVICLCSSSPGVRLGTAFCLGLKGAHYHKPAKTLNILAPEQIPLHAGFSKGEEGGLNVSCGLLKTSQKNQSFLIT